MLGVVTLMTKCFIPQVFKHPLHHHWKRLMSNLVSDWLYMC